MWKTVAIILIGLFALQGLAAASEGYEVGTITAVLLHEDSTGNASAASYEVSVKVGNTT